MKVKIEESRNNSRKPNWMTVKKKIIKGRRKKEEKNYNGNDKNRNSQ